MKQINPKIQFILDSMSCYPKKEINKLGFEFLPQLVIFDHKEYKDGEDINLKETINLLKTSKEATTSQVPIGLIENTFKKLSQNYQSVIYLPMNRGISSTYDTTLKISKAYPNVKVLDLRLVGSALIDAATRSQKLYQKNANLNQAINLIKKINLNSYCYFVPKNLDAFIKGGRLKGGKKFILQKAGLIPRLRLKDDGIKVTGVKRSVTKNIVSSIQKIIHHIGQEKINDYYWEILHGYDEDTIKVARQALKSIGVKKPIETPSATVILVHTGLGVVGINVWPKND